MNTLSRYWKIWRINPAAENLGYKQISVTVAQDFVNHQVDDVKNNQTQNILLSCFHAETSEMNKLNSARAGLCLRCYVSEPILKQCKKIASLFSGEKQFTYRDLLPFVLNDDGEKLIVLDRDGKTQLMIDDDCQIKPSSYKLFSVTILQTFNAELQSRMSLDNWAYLQTKQNPELKKFLSEFGFNHLSDWALLNRTGSKQLERFLMQERYVVEAFHAVYRRDRQQQQIKGAKKCPDPTNAQLQEMLIYLQQHQIWINTPVQLMKELKQIVQQLRQYDIWSSRESLDIYDVESGTYVPRPDLSSSSLDLVAVEEQEFSQFLKEHLYTTLTQTIKQQVEANIDKLQKSKKYAPFAQKYIQGLELYYHKAMSLKEITPKLGMTSWDQARRILNPGELLSKVRAKTVEQMLESVLKKAAEKGLTKIPPEANYLIAITEQIESYIDGEIFQQAAEEIRAGQNRNMSSVYAQAIRCYIQEFTSNCISIR
ncbi:hypothetical protein IQ247_09530 [Plectonema cf. radiosum LEGE 06105]|uniref:Uncharacterized protein n=1 Tax=Plectonema cf. radiosum LEGE 06105 TaxID=945769 RepID=A0A8J7F198_9CYAN|nr:hypothetical protein [Plectonema radiosum]MBE9212927.1 hypothetical protein [Plectonema cf. radiosum LEGE 06105]